MFNMNESLYTWVLYLWYLKGLSLPLLSAIKECLDFDCHDILCNKRHQRLRLQL